MGRTGFVCDPDAELGRTDALGAREPAPYAVRASGRLRPGAGQNGAMSALPGLPTPHAHDFGLGAVRRGERRTRAVALLTAGFMVVEVVGGLLFGSMAVLADGLHMASHAAALGLSVAAYVYARRRAHDPRFSFGVGKVNALGGFSGALLLALFAAVMAVESLRRLVEPQAIDFGPALLVAGLGLAVNLLSAVLLLGGREPGVPAGHEHDPHHDHDHDHEHDAAHDHEHDPEHVHDHNLEAAYLHVVADALTSLLALAALLGARHLGWAWLDPAMGIVGAVLVARWSWGLLRGSARVLLDRQAPEAVLHGVRAALESSGVQVLDLHVWTIGPGLRAACVTVAGAEPPSPAELKARLPSRFNVVHATVEVQRAPARP